MDKAVLRCPVNIQFIPFQLSYRLATFNVIIRKRNGEVWLDISCSTTAATAYNLCLKLSYGYCGTAEIKKREHKLKIAHHSFFDIRGSVQSKVTIPVVVEEHFQDVEYFRHLCED